MAENAGKEPTGPGEELLTREEAARRLCISNGEFRRRQRIGDIVPVKKKGPKGEVMFKAKDVDALDAIRNRRKNNYSMEQAAEMFALMETGATPIDCVIKLKINPEAVEELTHAYANLKKAIFIDADKVRTINKLPINAIIESVEDLLDFLNSTIEEVKCKECGKHQRMFCKPCVQDAIKEAKAVASGTAEL